MGAARGGIVENVGVAVPDATVHAVDTNARARDLTRSNAERAGVGSRVVVAAPDEVPASLVFDEIWSNPPIRIGKAAPGNALRGSVERGRLLVMIDRGDYWQCAFLIPKGAAARAIARP